MASNHVAAHPGWCDPRLCTTESHNVDHRSAPMAWKPSVDDFWITTGLARLDGDRAGDVGTTTVRVDLRDLASNNVDGSERLLGVDLSSADARLLAAALVCAAEQLEDLQRGVTR